MGTAEQITMAFFGRLQASSRPMMGAAIAGSMFLSGSGVSHSQCQESRAWWDRTTTSNLPFAPNWWDNTVDRSKPTKSWQVDDILNDSAARYWLPTLPECFLKETRRGYLPSEIQTAAQVCNVNAPKPTGRSPRLIFQLGAAGTGKSTRMQDCYGTMGITSSNELVVADGDSIRETHAGVVSAFALNKGSLLSAMQAAGSPELADYTEQLKDFPDTHPIGFKDSEHWCYNDSGKYKEQFANEALAAKQDVIMGITNVSQINKKYKSVIDNAKSDGYQICAMSCLVEPEVLVERQVGRGKRKGRLVQTHKSITDGDLLKNAALKQKLAIDTLPVLIDLVQSTGGSFAIFNNTPNFFADPSSKQPAFFIIEAGKAPYATYEGEASVAGMMAFIAKTIQA